MTHPIYDRLPIEMRAELIEKYEASTKIYRKPFETWNYFFKIYNTYFNVHYARTKNKEHLEDVTCGNCRVKVEYKIFDAVKYYKEHARV